MFRPVDTLTFFALHVFQSGKTIYSICQALAGILGIGAFYIMDSHSNKPSFQLDHFRIANISSVLDEAQNSLRYGIRCTLSILSFVPLSRDVLCSLETSLEPLYEGTRGQALGVPQPAVVVKSKPSISAGTPGIRRSAISYIKIVMNNELTVRFR